MFTRTSGVGYVKRIRVKLIRGVRNSTETKVVYEVYDVVNEFWRCSAVNDVCRRTRASDARAYCRYGETEKNGMKKKEGRVSNKIHNAGTVYYDV